MESTQDGGKFDREAAAKTAASQERLGKGGDMVLEHQGLLPSLQSNAGLQPALQLYAAAAAQLAPRARVPPWAPFLQFNPFGGPFLTRPRFGPGPGGPQSLAGLSGLSALSAGGSGPHQGLGLPRTVGPGPPSDDSNEDHGKSKN